MRFSNVFYAAAALLSCGFSGHAETLWQIGEFDNSCREFGAAGAYQRFAGLFPGQVMFDPGADKTSAWPAIHPGPVDAWAGSRSHRFTISFYLASVPAGVPVLKIAAAGSQEAIPPSLEIAMNGRSARAALPRGLGQADQTAPTAQPLWVLERALPAGVLRTGKNTLTLETQSGSWFLYDAISLAVGAVQSPKIDEAELTPTMRFVREGGRLRQVVNLRAQCRSGRGCSVTLVSSGSRRTVALSPDLLGGVSGEILVDEVRTPTPLSAFLRCGSETREVKLELRPQRHWKLYVQPSAHVDIGYTDFQERIIDLHNRNTRAALDVCERFPSFRWNTEAAWVEDNFLRMASDDDRERFVKLAREGRVGCPAMYGNMLTGICSGEELIRCLYPAARMGERFGIPLEYAMQSDVPTYVWTLPSILAGSGIRYFSAGLNLTRADSFNRLYSRSPFYWEGPDGARVLTWFAPGYAWASGLGLAESPGAAASRVEGFLAGFDRADYPYDAALAFGGFSDNRPLDKALGQVVDAWNQRYAYPQIILCRGPEFFRYVEGRFRARIPVIRGDGGTYWEDGAASSALESSAVRRGKETLATAEKLHAYAKLVGGSSYPAEKIRAAWRDAILYDEHTWGAADSISQPDSEQTRKQWEYKGAFARRAEAASRDLLRTGMEAAVKAARVSRPSVLVFNPSGRVRSGAVEARDASGREVALWAENVPPMGVRAFALPARSPASFTVCPSPPVLENRFYRIEFDAATGAIRSIIDRELGREIVDATSPHLLNQWRYVSGQGAGRADRGLEPRAAAVFRQRTGPDSSEVDVVTSGYRAPRIVSRIVLWHKTKRIDLVNDVDKEETREKEAVYFAFPFALENPVVDMGIPGGVMRPDRDMLPGACMEWYCTQGFVSLADAKAAVTWVSLDSPLVTLGDVNPDTFRSPVPARSGRLWAYVMNNYWFTNYKASQGGRLRFAYSLTSAPRMDAAASSRFAESLLSPMPAAIRQPRSSGQPLSSLCSVDAPNVILQVVKQAESGRGTIVRLRETAGRKTSTVVTTAPGVFGHWTPCNLLERPVSSRRALKDALRVTIPANGMVTILLDR